MLRDHGSCKRYYHEALGINSRLDELQAAVLRIKLRNLDIRNQRRNDIAAFYSQRFATIDVRTPHAGVGETHAYHQYVIRTAHRDRLRQHLADAGVETGIHYPVPLHRQPAFLSRYGETQPLPRSEQLAREILSLPVFPDLTEAEVERVADSVVAFFGGE